MSYMHQNPIIKRQFARGFSLIELMISLAIGLLIMASVVTIYINSNRTSRISEVESQMNEDGLIALNLIQAQIRMAGYTNFEDFLTTQNPNFLGAGVRGCSAAAFYPNAAAQPLFNDLTDTDCAATSSLGDGIVIRYEADTGNTIPTSAGLPSNCLMNGAYQTTNSAGLDYYLAENRYYVAASGTNPPSLYCAAGTGAITSLPQMQPIFDNIEKMEFLYGISATNAVDDVQVVTYLNAVDVDTAFASEAVNDRWRRVVSVKVCLLMRSAETMKDIVATATYRDCDGTSKTLATPDGYMRRAFLTTATLRNRLTVTDRRRRNES